MFQPTLLKKWTDEQIEQMRSAIFVAEHRLAELPLFKDEELIRVLDKHPRKDLGVNTMGDDPARREDWQEGDAGDLDGRTLLEITKRGRLWLNVRRVMDHHPEFAQDRQHAVRRAGNAVRRRDVQPVGQPVDLLARRQWFTTTSIARPTCCGTFAARSGCGRTRSKPASCRRRRSKRC